MREYVSGVEAWRLREMLDQEFSKLPRHAVVCGFALTLHVEGMREINIEFGSCRGPGSKMRELPGYSL